MARISFKRSLERCLQELTRTGDVEASLRCYPQYAGRLRPLLEMAQATYRYYEAVPEAPGGLAAGRERLLAMAAQQRARGVGATSATRTATTRTAGRKIKLVLATRLIAVLLVVVVGTAALGGGVVWAAGDSLPGDLLYPVKLATEDVRLALASAPADQVDLALQFVERRAEEVQTLVVAGRQVPDETIARMERHIERALTQAAWASDEEMTGLLTRVAERTRTQAQVLEQVRATAPQQAQAGLEHAATVCRQGAEAAEDGLNDPQAFRRRYRHQRGARPEPAEGTPEPTSVPEQVTVTPGGDQEQDQERYQQQDQERTHTPVGAPHITPHGLRATLVPQATPRDAQTTPMPQVTPHHGPQATPVPQATPHGPQATPVPPAATPRHQDPGREQGGGEQDGSEHDGGGRGS